MYEVSVFLIKHFLLLTASDFKRELERKEQAKKQSQRVDFVHGGEQTAQIPTLPDKTKVALPISSGQKGGLIRINYNESYRMTKYK